MYNDKCEGVPIMFFFNGIFRKKMHKHIASEIASSKVDPKIDNDHLEKIFVSARGGGMKDCATVIGDCTKKWRLNLV